MLLTMRERDSVRPVTLFYANRSWEDVTFREQLSELEESMPEEPPEDWTGETGRIDAETIRRHVHERTLKRLEYFVCGVQIP